MDIYNREKTQADLELNPLKFFTGSRDEKKNCVE